MKQFIKDLFTLIGAFITGMRIGVDLIQKWTKLPWLVCLVIGIIAIPINLIAMIAIVITGDWKDFMEFLDSEEEELNETEEEFTEM